MKQIGNYGFLKYPLHFDSLRQKVYSHIMISQRYKEKDVDVPHSIDQIGNYGFHYIVIVSLSKQIIFGSLVSPSCAELFQLCIYVCLPHITIFGNKNILMRSFHGQ